jgi:integrase
VELADLWQPIRKYYERVPEPERSPPKVLTAEEEDRFFRFASRKPEWRMAYHSAAITSNTTIAGCELRVLRLEHLHLDGTPPVVHVPRAVKNRNRIRVVPLNAVALASFRELVGIAKKRGSCEPGHYLIPYRMKRGMYDPNRDASSGFIRTAFRRIARSCGPWLGHPDMLPPPGDHEAARRWRTGRDCACHRWPSFGKGDELLQPHPDRSKEKRRGPLGTGIAEASRVRSRRLSPPHAPLYYAVNRDA